MSNIRKILLVNNDNNLRSTLAEQISLHQEFSVTTINCSIEAILAIKPDLIDLVIIDDGVSKSVYLPEIAEDKINGYAALKTIRNNEFKSPIIFLATTDAEAVLGLEAGANDYVVKPFRFAVLLARVRTHLRQYEASEDAVFQVGPYSFRPSAKLLITQEGIKLRLTEKETAILRYLYRAGDKITGRNVLLQEVWGYNSQVATHTLETHIYRLRQKIEIDPTTAQLLITEAGGYRLIP
jgi:DNA-binding response OmpR family regulator